jgi:anti-anti-sigma factor
LARALRLVQPALGATLRHYQTQEVLVLVTASQATPASQPASQPANQQNRLVYRVRLSKDFDGAYRRRLRAEIITALACGRREFVVDCSAWDRLDLAVLSVLIQCAKACGDRQADFELVNVPSGVRSSIHALRLEHRLRLSA